LQVVTNRLDEPSFSTRCRIAPTNLLIGWKFAEAQRFIVAEAQTLGMPIGVFFARRRQAMTDLDVQGLIFGDTPIGEIAVRLPGATAIFRKRKLDYCCGGATSLAEAVERRGIDLAEVERLLAELIPRPTDVPEDSKKIIDLIVSRYHDTHRRELPELIQLARRVERVHAGHPDVPNGLAEFLEQINEDLGSHMQKEELVLFPMIRTGHPMVSAPIAAMQAEHVDHGQALEELSALTHDMQSPQGACGSWRALYVGLRKLSNDLIEHIHIENNILFPRFAG